MLERLASLQHEIWSLWMTYLFKVSILNKDGSVTVPADKINQWKRQMQTHYLDLSNDERKSGLEQAQKVIDAIASDGNR